MIGTTELCCFTYALQRRELCRFLGPTLLALATCFGITLATVLVATACFFAVFLIRTLVLKLLGGRDAGLTVGAVAAVLTRVVVAAIVVGAGSPPQHPATEKIASSFFFPQVVAVLADMLLGARSVYD